MKMEQIVCSEKLANHNRTPGKYPKEYIQDSKLGESLKSRNYPAYKGTSVTMLLKNFVKVPLYW